MNEWNKITLLVQLRKKKKKKAAKANEDDTLMHVAGNMCVLKVFSFFFQLENEKNILDGCLMSSFGPHWDKINCLFFLLFSYAIIFLFIYWMYV